MGKEETYKERLQKEGRDEDLFAPKKREPRGFVLHGGEAKGEQAAPSESEEQPEDSIASDDPGRGRKAA